MLSIKNRYLFRYIPEPNEEQLVSIAEKTSKMHELITQESPRDKTSLIIDELVYVYFS